MQRRRRNRIGRTRLLLIAALPWLAGCAGGEGTEVVAEVAQQREANRILVGLADAGIEQAIVKKETEQRRVIWEVRVPASRVLDARRELVRLGLPRPGHAGFDELFADSGLIPSAVEEQARLMHATAGELARTFEVYDDVVAARVHIILPETEGLRSKGDDRRAPSALVVLKCMPGHTFTEDRVATMLAEAVDGLDKGSVKVAITEIGGGAAAIERLIEHRDDVVDAAVHVKTKITDTSLERSAIVAVRFLGPEPSVDAIKTLVAGALGIDSKDLVEVRMSEVRDPEPPAPVSKTTRYALAGLTALLGATTLLFAALWSAERRRRGPAGDA